MEAQFWHDRWTANQIGFHQTEINRHLQSYWSRLNAPKGSTIFVPLCGKSLDMLWLLEQGYRVFGVELSTLAVEAFFTENQLSAKQETVGAFTRWKLDELEIWCGDFFQLTAEDLSHVTAVYDRASLIALPPEMRQAYQQQLLSILPPQIAILLITLNYPQHLVKGPPFSVPEKEVYSLYQADFNIELLDRISEPAMPRFQEKGVDIIAEEIFSLTR